MKTSPLGAQAVCTYREELLVTFRNLTQLVGRMQATQRRVQTHMRLHPPDCSRPLVNVKEAETATTSISLSGVHKNPHLLR